MVWFFNFWRLIVDKGFWIILLVFLLSSCFSPKRAFDKMKPPKAPDYSKTQSWSTLPNKRDSADLCIKAAGIIECQDSAKVDVFYVHPTTYLYGSRWNSSITKGRVNKLTDVHAVRNQASAFNGVGKVYAPRYRQAILSSYSAKSTKSGSGPKALDLAYSDVKAAFAYYLKHYNNGRPIIIASHSQGTHHSVRLLRDFFEKDSVLKKQLVAAYIIGMPFKKGEIKGILPCDSANQTGCYITWNAVPYGETTLYDIKFDSLECTNPLSWTRDTIACNYNKNRGGLPQTFNRVDVGLVDAKISNTGLLWVHRPKVSSKDYPTINSNRYHILDYNLFYMNIRENARRKVNQYFRLCNNN